MRFITTILFLCLFLSQSWVCFASQKVITTEFQIRDIELAIYRFGADCHRFPSNEEGLGALLEAPAQTPQWAGPYLNRPRIPYDPWGKPYIYIHPMQYGGDRFDLYSTGINGVDEHGAGDDVSSWKGYDRKIYSHFNFDFETLLGLVILLDLPVLAAGYLGMKVWRFFRRRQQDSKPTNH